MPVSIGRQFLLDANFYWMPVSIGRQFLLDAAPYFCHYHCDTTQRVDSIGRRHILIYDM